MPPSSALRRLRRARRRTFAGILIGLAVPVGGIIGAFIDRPSMSPPDCIARDAEIAQLVRTEPALVPVLEHQHDPLDRQCGSAATIVRVIASGAAKTKLKP